MPPVVPGGRIVAAIASARVAAGAALESATVTTTPTSGSSRIVLKPDRASFTPLDFLAWRETKSLAVAPEFQRRSVWGRPARASLIDTLLRGLPVPPIYLRVKQSGDKKRLVREVIDGQQRLSAVLDYLDGRFALLPSFDAAWAGKEFGELSDTDQDAIRTYPFLCEVFHSISDAQVLEIFARLNTYSVQLNAQELRNGRYFGYFKQTAYALAREHVEFWRLHRILTERSIARMDDAELASELMILQLDGLQDKKKSISAFYAEFDETFPSREQVETRFRATIDGIGSAVDFLGETEFRRRPLFYSLYGAVYHHRYGIPHVKMPTPKRALKRSAGKETSRNRGRPKRDYCRRPQRCRSAKEVDQLRELLIASDGQHHPAPRETGTALPGCLLSYAEANAFVGGGFRPRD